MMDIIGINELDDFIVEQIEQKKVILLYFGAEWCGPCKQLKKRLQQTETVSIMPDLAVAHMDVDEELNAKIVKRYKITSLPTQIFIRVDNNKIKEISRIEGYDFTKLKLGYDNY